MAAVDRGTPEFKFSGEHASSTDDETTCGHYRTSSSRAGHLNSQGGDPFY